MVDSPREVIGAVLKHMGASYNTKNMSSEIPGGKDAVQQNLTSLAKQVRYISCSNQNFSVRTLRMILYI